MRMICGWCSPDLWNNYREWCVIKLCPKLCKAMFNDWFMFYPLLEDMEFFTHHYSEWVFQSSYRIITNHPTSRTGANRDRGNMFSYLWEFTNCMGRRKSQHRGFSAFLGCEQRRVHDFDHVRNVELLVERRRCSSKWWIAEGITSSMIHWTTVLWSRWIVDMVINTVIERWR